MQPLVRQHALVVFQAQKGPQLGLHVPLVQGHLKGLQRGHDAEKQEKEQGKRQENVGRQGLARRQSHQSLPLPGNNGPVRLFAYASRCARAQPARQRFQNASSSCCSSAAAMRMDSAGSMPCSSTRLIASTMMRRCPSSSTKNVAWE